MREVTLEEILNAREERMRDQSKMLQRYSKPLISFSMNIAGPVKNTPLIKRAFDEGLSMLEKALDEEGIPVIGRIYKDSVTGCEVMFAADAPAEHLKAICVGIEEGTALGRLFDMDIIAADGVKLERATERKCLICGAPGRGCASRRVHTVEELQLKTRQIISGHFALAESVRVSEMVTDSLIEEVLTTPKPGLVDRNNNGSHSDMDIGTFKISAESLRPFWKTCFLLGFDSKAEAPERTFLLLRKAGAEAEKEMLKATGGVNTHKGAVFFMGVICGAIGRMFDAGGGKLSCRNIADECVSMTGKTVSSELSVLSEHPEEAKTFGEKIWASCGVSGARGEISEGLPSIMDTGLPVFEKLLKKGFSRNDAGAAALIAMIARGPDTNMIKRGGYDTAKEASSRAEKLVSDGTYSDIAEIRALDDRFISLGLSPGGYADMLAVTYFLHDYCSSEGYLHSQ